MLRIVVPASESYDEGRDEFITTKEQVLQLEHSLVSLSKWESKWHKAFLDPKTQKTSEETIDYIRCMTLTQNVDPNVYYHLTEKNILAIKDYIDNPMTATTFSDKQRSKPSREIITNELLYYYMIANNVPVEFEKWHLNRLLVLLHICEIKNAAPKKMSKKDILKRNVSLNAARRQALNSSG